VMPTENRVADEDDVIMLLDGVRELRRAAARESLKYNSRAEAFDRIEAHT